MTAKTTKTTSAHEQAIADTKERVAELEALVSALTTELDRLRTERDELQHLHDHGYDLDIDRLAELAENLVPRREARLKMLETDTLPEAERDAERAVLLELASRDADGIPGKRAAYRQAVSDAEAKVTEALAEVRAAAAEWSTFINPVSDSARAARLSDTRHVIGDYVEHPISYKASAASAIGYSRADQPVPIIFEGETYQAVNADAAVRRVVGKADPYVGRLVLSAHDAEVIADGQRIQALTAHR